MSFAIKCDDVKLKRGARSKIVLIGCEIERRERSAPGGDEGLQAHGGVANIALEPKSVVPTALIKIRRCDLLLW